jgi:FkbM family methyltransferase
MRLRQWFDQARWIAFARFARSLSFESAMRCSQGILEAQGFGAGSLINRSGERYVFELLENPKPVLIDVGAFFGAYTEAFLSRHPIGRAIVFEPSADNFSVLSERLGARAEVSCYRVALGDRSGTATLYKTAGVSSLASLTRRRLDHFAMRMDVEENVDIDTLDNLVDRLNITFIDLLKIDVEGHELDVLNGARQCLAERRIQMVQFEFGGCNLDTRTTFQDFFYFFKEFGFRMHLIRPGGNIIELRKYSEFLEQYRTTNFLATMSGRGD